MAFGPWEVFLLPGEGKQWYLCKEITQLVFGGMPPELTVDS